MGYVDAHKQREKTIVRNDAGGLITRLARLEGDVDGLAAEARFTAGGAPSGMGEVMEGDLRLASEQLSRALGELRACRGCIQRLDVEERADDG